MINPCCGQMKFFGRDRYPGVPESNLPDALIEIDHEQHRAMMLFPDQGHTMRISFCPWCGTSLDQISN